MEILTTNQVVGLNNLNGHFMNLEEDDLEKVTLNHVQQISSFGRLFYLAVS